MMGDEFRDEVEAALARELATSQIPVPRDGHPHVTQVADEQVAVEWRLADGSTSLLESGLSVCEAVLTALGYDVRTVNASQQLLVARGTVPKPS